MVIITDANGNIQAPTIPDNVYQGSNLANEIVFLAPLAQSNTVTITFRKPNGILIEELIMKEMTPYTSVPSEYNLSAWRYVIEDVITDLYGQVTFQIKVRNGQGTVITSVGGTFPVLRGVPSIPSSEPSTSKWQAILDYVASIQADIDNGWLEARGLLPYHEDFEYSLGASVFDKATTSIYTSLIDNNVGNPLSDAIKWGKTEIYNGTAQDIQEMIDSSISTHNSSATAHQELFNSKQDKIDLNDSEINLDTIEEGFYILTNNNITIKYGGGSIVGGKGYTTSILRVIDISSTARKVLFNDYNNNIYEFDKLSGNWTYHIIYAIPANDLTTTNQYQPLSALQGKILNETKQDKIDANHKLSADLVDDSSTTNKFVTSSEKAQITINQNNISTINSKIPAEASSSNQVADKEWVKDNYVPISFASRLYLSKTGTNTAELVNTAPTPSVTNTLVVTSTNTSFDWNTPTLTITRTLETAIQLNNTNSFAVDLYFDLSRNTELTFGAKIKVSTDNGTTWTYISSNQSFGEKAYNNGFNSEDIVVYTDLATNETYPIGTLVAIELFKKQEQNSSLTTTYYCGVEIDGANVYSFVEFNFANTRINTNQIEDGAVTYDKLSQDVKDMIANPLPSHTGADVGKVLTVDNQNQVVWDYTKDEFVMFTKTNSSGTLAVTSAEWVSAMNNDKAILRVTDGTDYYILYKVKYDATTVYFQGDGKEAQFIKDGVNYSGTFEDASTGVEPFTTAEMEEICDDIFYPALPAPTNVTASGTDISFDEVQGAESYIVYANGNEIGEVQA